jgi:hypothetical protein
MNWRLGSTTGAKLPERSRFSSSSNSLEGLLPILLVSPFCDWPCRRLFLPAGSLPARRPWQLLKVLEQGGKDALFSMEQLTRILSLDGFYKQHY